MYHTQLTKHISEGNLRAFQTHGKHHQKATTGVPVAPQKEFMSSNFFFKEYTLGELEFIFERTQGKEHNKK